MDLNGFVFPSPKFDFNIVRQFDDELIYIPTNDNKHIPCIFIRDKTSKLSKNFIIFFHGNAEDVFSARSIGCSLHKKIGMNIIVVEYPGYSIYKGSPEAEKILQNTATIYDFVKKQFHLEDKNIFIFGRSIGTSPAIYLSSVRKPNALFVISAFTSIRAVADNLVGPLKYLLKERLSSKDYIKTVTCPILFVHGQSDPLIPFKETLLLKEQCNCPFEVLLPEEMTHNDFDLDDDIIEPIHRFIKRNCVIDEEKNEFENFENEIEKLYIMPQEISDYIIKNLK
jgi:esterase/lipase